MLYEIWSLGYKPFEELSGVEVKSFLDVMASITSIIDNTKA